jgi:hypothetical protein
MNPYYKKYDSGNNATPKAPVKSFVEEPSNLKLGSPLDLFCKSIHKNSGDSTPYCYDYNDLGSSIYLRTPYKIKLTFTDLDM